MKKIPFLMIIVITTCLAHPVFPAPMTEETMEARLSNYCTDSRFKRRRYANYCKKIWAKDEKAYCTFAADKPKYKLAVREICGDVAVAAPATTTDSGQVKKSPQAADPDLETWNLVKNSNDIQSVKMYLEAFPQGKFRVAAKVLLRKLQKSSSEDSSQRPSSPEKKGQVTDVQEKPGSEIISESSTPDSSLKKVYFTSLIGDIKKPIDGHNGYYNIKYKSFVKAGSYTKWEINYGELLGDIIIIGEINIYKWNFHEKWASAVKFFFDSNKKKSKKDVTQYEAVISGFSSKYHKDLDKDIVQLDFSDNLNTIKLKHIKSVESSNTNPFKIKVTFWIQKGEPNTAQIFFNDEYFGKIANQDFDLNRFEYFVVGSNVNASFDLYESGNPEYSGMASRLDYSIPIK